MSLTVDDVLQHARDAHELLDDRKAPSGPVLRYLTRYQQRLLTEIVQWKRDALVKTFEALLPPSSFFDEGVKVPEYLHVHGGDIVFENEDLEYEELRLVGYDRRNARIRWGAYLQGRTLKPLGRSSDWSNVARIDLHYFPRGETLEDGTSEFILPGSALNCLGMGAAVFMARRQTGFPGPDLQGLAAALSDAESGYLDDVTQRRQAVVRTIAETY